MSKKTNRPEYWFALPESFDPREFLTDHLVKRLDDARYLVGLIMYKHAYQDVDATGAVILQGQFLKRIMATHDYRAVVGSLQKDNAEDGAIVRDNYIKGTKSYGYKIGKRFKADPHVCVRATDKRLIRRLEQFHDERKQAESARWSPVHYHLAKQQYRLGIDAERARELIPTLPPGKKGKFCFDAQGIIVSDLERHRMRFSVGQYGRVSNSITSLSRVLRPTLHHQGRPLLSVDIRCCQPALLGSLVRTKFNHVQEGQERNKDTSIYDSQKCTPIGRCATLARLESDDKGLFCRLAQKGELYEHLLGYLPGWSRDKVKKRLLCDVFAKGKLNRNGAEYFSEIEDVFERLFPNEYRYIREINCDGWEHENLIRELQRSESDLVISDVAEGLRIRHPDMFMVTVHDSIFSTEENIPTIENEFERAFADRGYAMALKVE